MVSKWIVISIGNKKIMDIDIRAEHVALLVAALSMIYVVWEVKARKKESNRLRLEMDLDRVASDLEKMKDQWERDLEVLEAGQNRLSSDERVPPEKKAELVKASLKTATKSREIVSWLNDKIDWLTTLDTSKMNLIKLEQELLSSGETLCGSNQKKTSRSGVTAAGLPSSPPLDTLTIYVHRRKLFIRNF